MFQRHNGSTEVVQRLASLQAMEVAVAGSSGIGGRLDLANGPNNRLLPMAIAEGSPVHPAYGAGHAAVAGACVTIRKAWFDCGRPLVDHNKARVAFVASNDGSVLVDISAGLAAPHTIEGELNKLAANIAIGRNRGGVHHDSDDIESFRLGEEVAVRLLREPKLTCSENFSMTVPLSGGTSVRIRPMQTGTRGRNATRGSTRVAISPAARPTFPCRARPSRCADS